MTYESRKKLARIQVAVCNGPSCDAEIDADDFPYTPTWFSVEQSYRQTDGLRAWDRREWHFCSFDCLQSWAKDQAEKKVPVTK
jgi:hypothetical protein